MKSPLSGITKSLRIASLLILFLFDTVAASPTAGSVERNQFSGFYRGYAEIAYQTSGSFWSESRAGCLKSKGTSGVGRGDCNDSTTPENWRLNDNGTIEAYDGGCLTTRTTSTSTKLDREPCGHHPGQRWTIEMIDEDDPTSSVMFVDEEGNCLGRSSNNRVRMKDCDSKDVDWVRDGWARSALPNSNDLEIDLLYDQNDYMYDAEYRSQIDGIWQAIMWWTDEMDGCVEIDARPVDVEDGSIWAPRRGILRGPQKLTVALDTTEGASRNQKGSFTSLEFRNSSDFAFVVLVNPTNDTFEETNKVAAHEIGHAMGLIHRDSGLMPVQMGQMGQQKDDWAGDVSRARLVHCPQTL